MASDKITEQELGSMFTEVRKSYRFIYLFQQRVLDIVDFIGKYYGIEYEKGQSHYSNAYYQGKPSIKNTAWEWLPMYHMEFRFNCEEGYKFSVLLQCDTGYYDIENPQTELKTQLDSFLPPEESKTMIHLVFWAKDQNIQNYKNTQVKSTELDFFEDKENEGLLLGYKTQLEKLLDEDSTKEQLEIFTRYVFDKIKID